jgi:hypothetical protein
VTVWRDLWQVRPRSFTTGRPGGKPRIIFVHYTAGAEGPTSAEDGAAYDTRRSDGTSAHYYVDRDSVVQCVDTAHRAHTALYNANLVGIHYELCGTVQTRAQWLDAASRPMLRVAARQIARDMTEFTIPLKRLVGRQVRPAAAKGLAGHVDATNGWPEDGGTHTDPGTAFPWDVLFDDIQKELDAMSPAPVGNSEVPKSESGYGWTWANWFRKYSSSVLALIGRVKTLDDRVTATERRSVDTDGAIAQLRADVDALKAQTPPGGQS